jgi:hypothetical protein
MKADLNESSKLNAPSLSLPDGTDASMDFSPDEHYRQGLLDSFHWRSGVMSKTNPVDIHYDRVFDVQRFCPR